YRRLSFPLAILACSALYFILTRFVLMDWFAGGTPMHWESFWSDVWGTDRGHLSTIILLLISFSFLPLLQVRLFVLTILPILVLHLYSYHPWHKELLGHYGYAVLPFILLAFIRSTRRVIGWFHLFERPSLSIPFMLLLLAAAMFGASRDSALPVMRQTPDPRYATVETLMQTIPAGSCVQTQSPFSAHAPLDVLVFPLMIPEQNAYHNKMPGPHNFEAFHFEKPFCDEYYVLIDLNEVRIPDYTQEHVRAFDEYARNNMQLMVERDSVRLYRFTMIGVN
ncbi:MAG: DUF2079 domain-containing protein, partial [Leptospiraceae bacterium]|nr:DUF2079 domain-containing protein [Leptospiraceae bacterium]